MQIVRLSYAIVKILKGDKIASADSRMDNVILIHPPQLRFQGYKNVSPLENKDLIIAVVRSNNFK